MSDDLDCGKIATDMKQRTGAEIRSTLRSDFLLSHPLFEMRINCFAQPEISVASKDQAPSHSWFLVAASAGQAITGADPEDLESALWRCYLAALMDPSESAKQSIQGATVKCHASLREGGALRATISVGEELLQEL